MSARRRPALFAPGHETVLDMFVEALRTRGWHVRLYLTHQSENMILSGTSVQG